MSDQSQQPDLVLVLHENGIVAPVGRVFAETYKLNIVEGDAVDLCGRPVAPVRENGRAVKPRRNLQPLASGGAGAYKAMTAKQLKAEIEERNADRALDQQLAATGNKAALVAVLERDDADHADPDTSESSDAPTGAPDEAVTPTEGAADSTLTNP